MAFPLLPPRRGDRIFAPPFSPAHDLLLEIPAAKRGRVRLQLSMPWRDEQGEMTLAVEWAKAAPAPRIKRLAMQIWRIVTGPAGSRRTRRPGLLSFRLTSDAWQGVLYIRAGDRADASRVDSVNAVIWLEEALRYVRRMLVGRWWRSKRDTDAWIVAMHWYFALLAADDLARDYLMDRSAIKSPVMLQRAEPTFRQQIQAAAWSSRRVTPRRLAFALVDAKFRQLRPFLLCGQRLALADGTLWNRVMPPDQRRRLRALLRGDPYVARWYTRWRSLMVHGPLLDYRFFETPGEEDLAARVWYARHR